jgi:succinoglycan biosynthesis protein ExoL
LRIAYFVHDLTDPAVGKRVRMLRAAGAEIVVLGFRREDRTVTAIEGAQAVDLGRTYDAKFAQRTLKVLRRAFSLGRGRREIIDADVLLARNLEMLAIASAARRNHARKAVLAYECLDLHRLVLSTGAAGGVLRSIERWLMRKASLLIVSSPAFLSQYFERTQGVNRTFRLPVLLVENKVVDLASDNAEALVSRSTDNLPGPPWRIGWFGMIRCRRSLDMLCRLVRDHPGVIEVIIRGRPARGEFEDFEAQVNRTPGIHFGGPYHPSQLENLYSNVHFNWSIDYFEVGANSALLLPNRIYEGGSYGVVPIALADTETGRWLQRRGLGLLLSAEAGELSRLLSHLTPSSYAELSTACRLAPRSLFVADREDCKRLLDALTTACSAASQSGARQVVAPSGAELFPPVR